MAAFHPSLPPNPPYYQVLQKGVRTMEVSRLEAHESIRVPLFSIASTFASGVLEASESEHSVTMNSSIDSDPIVDSLRLFDLRRFQPMTQ